MDEFDVPTAEGPSGRKWTVDRRIPIALIIAVILSMITWSGCLVWWVSGINASVVALDGRVTHLEADSKVVSMALQQVQVLLGRIDERTAFLADTMRRSGDHK